MKETYIVYCYLYDYDEEPTEKSIMCHSLQKALAMAEEEKGGFDFVTIYKATEILTLHNEEAW